MIKITQKVVERGREIVRTTLGSTIKGKKQPTRRSTSCLKLSRMLETLKSFKLSSSRFAIDAKVIKFAAAEAAAKH
jgi:hypothetical protein